MPNHETISINHIYDKHKKRHGAKYKNLLHHYNQISKPTKTRPLIASKQDAQSFNVNQAKTSIIAHQSNTIKYNQSSNISNQIN